ncbi:MAG: peptidase S41, partial [Bacteroidota bacterium]
MKKIFTLLFLLQLYGGFAQEQAAYFLSDPSISPDGQLVVFSYEGDLWKVAVEGGLATRLTGLEGVESRPRISPDGKWLAFSSNQYSSQDIFVMPLAGGEIRQLTYHQASDDLESWSWDSQKLYFSSDRYNRFSSYEISLNGGTPKRLFPHYFNNIHNVCWHPNGQEVYFNESWESKYSPNRKRYKGPY